MKLKAGKYFLYILPGLVGLLGFFIPSLTYTLKIIVSLSLTTLYFVGLGIILQFKLNKANSNILTLNNKMDKYNAFIHKRKLFIDYDLRELKSLITEYEGNVKNIYRGQKHQEVRNEVGIIKKRTLDIINKEMRDFDEQLYNIQSDKDN